MSRPRVKDASMTPAECRCDSRDAMEWREIRAVEDGTRITDMARPRRATLRRWLIADASLRERYAAALDCYRMRVVEAAIEQADCDVEHARGRRRVAAMRRQVIARAQWLKLIAANAKCEEEDVPDGRVAPRPALKEGRGISDEGVAILESAAERFAAPAASNDDACGVNEAQREESREEESGESETPVSSSSYSVNSDAPLAHSASSSAPLFSERTVLAVLGAEDPRVFSRHPRESGGPESQTAASQTKDLDSRLRGNDENKNAPLAPSNDDDADVDADDSLLYAPEDARYRTRPHDKESRTSQPPPTGEKKSPWKPDTPTYVRFDVGGSFDVSNQRDQGTGWDTYDPFR